MAEHVQFDGHELLALRKGRGWSLDELSKRSGVSMSHISQLEKGTRKSPAIDRVYRLAQAFDVSMYRFLTRVERDNGNVRHATGTDGYPAPKPVAGPPARTADSVDWNAWSRELPPDVAHFMASENAADYVLFAKRLHDHRHSPRQVVQLIHEFMEGMAAHEKQAPEPGRDGG